MIVNFTARHTELTEDIKNYCEKRLERMGKILDEVQQIEVILTEEKSRKRVDLLVKRRGEDFALSEETTDMFNSLNKAFDSLERKIVKERRKLIQKRRRAASRQPVVVSGLGPKVEIGLRRFPYYSNQPISLGEAIVRLEEDRKEAFLFRKKDREGWAVVFRREDGTIGLVDPEG
ncbi:MAG: ribosome-associated translation inhibitor RaiA [Acidobacteriota bacterium]|nr:ribosome-associated translation inhibitor RaiA [Acidobacteriota bacterium]